MVLGKESQVITENSEVTQVFSGTSLHELFIHTWLTDAIVLRCWIERLNFLFQKTYIFVISFCDFRKEAQLIAFDLKFQLLAE